MSTIFQTLDAMPTLHPFYEIASIISVLTLRLHGRVTQRLAALSVHAFAMANTAVETGAVDPETMIWSVLNLSLNFCMLASLMRIHVGSLRRATGWGSLTQVRKLTFSRLCAWRATNGEILTSDRQFF